MNMTTTGPDAEYEVHMYRPAQYQKNSWCAATKESLLWRTSGGTVGKHSQDQGGQKIRYKDTLKAFFKDLNIPSQSWGEIVYDRAKWHCLIKRGTNKDKRICEAEWKREERKTRATGIIIIFRTDLLYLQ